MKNITPFSHTINKKNRSELLNQKPFLLWMTGLSASGKSTIADLLEKKLNSLGYCTYTLDGDNIRDGLNSDLSFSNEDRVENIRRIGEVGALFVDAGLITICAFISPFEEDRLMVRSLLSENEFFEVYIDTPIAICEERDPKGIYKKARSGEIRDFTGIDSPYESPKNPDIHIETHKFSPEEAVDIIASYLVKKKLIEKG